MALDVKEISERLKLKQKEKKLKQKDIIEKTNISKAAISNYFNGNRIPDTESILKLSIVLDTSIEWLLTGKSTNENLTEDELEVIQKFRILPEKERQRFIGRLDDRIEELGEGKSSGSAVG